MDMLLKRQISDEELIQRQRGINVARCSVRLEGFVLPPEVEAISARYVSGELTGDEHIAMIKAAVLAGRSQ